MTISPMSNRIKLKAPFLQESSEQNTPQTDLNAEDSSSEDVSVWCIILIKHLVNVAERQYKKNTKHHNADLDVHFHGTSQSFHTMAGWCISRGFFKESAVEFVAAIVWVRPQNTTQRENNCHWY